MLVQRRLGQSRAVVVALKGACAVSIFKRISDVVRSNVNSAIDAAEDPRKVLEQTIIDMAGTRKRL